jgi:hypothetical protein
MSDESSWVLSNHILDGTSIGELLHDARFLIARGDGDFSHVDPTPVLLAVLRGLMGAPLPGLDMSPGE